MSNTEPDFEVTLATEPQPLDLENHELSEEDIEALSIDPFENYTPEEE